MSNDNTITLVGNLTRDPELRFTASGRAVCQAGLAHNRRKKMEDGSWGDADPSFFNLVMWGTTAENAAASLEKGLRVVVTGELRQRTWETDEGEKRNSVEVIVDSIGPDLRWATVKVERNERKTGDNSNQDNAPLGDEEPW